MTPLPPSTWTEALQIGALDPRDPSTWRRQIGPGLALQGKCGTGSSKRLAAIDLEHHGEAIVRFQPGRPSLVRPFTRARYTDRMETNARRLAAINQALPAPLAGLALVAGRLEASTWRQVHRLTWDPADAWLDLADLEALGAAWPPGAWR